MTSNKTVNEFKPIENNFYVKVSETVLKLAVDGKLSSGAFLFYSALIGTIVKISYKQKNDKLLKRISFTNDELAGMTKVKNTQLKKYLNELEGNGIIKRESIRKSMGLNTWGNTRKIEILISAYVFKK